MIAHILSTSGHTTGSLVSYARVSDALGKSVDAAPDKLDYEFASETLPRDINTATHLLLANEACVSSERRLKSLHIIVSFPEGEKPTRAQMERIAKEVAATLKMADHHYICGVHRNTPNRHMHIVLSRVHPITQKLVAPYRAYEKLRAMSARLEVEMGFQVDNHRAGTGHRVVLKQDRAGRIAAGQFLLVAHAL